MFIEHAVRQISQLLLQRFAIDVCQALATMPFKEATQDVV